MSSNGAKSKLEETISHIGVPDEKAMTEARLRQNRLTKPQGSLGMLEELSIRVAGITGQPVPTIRDKVIIVAAGDHGIAQDGVSAYPQEVTAQMVLNFLRGGAAINVLAQHVGARVVVVDAGVAADLEPHPELKSVKLANGTGNIAKGPAMEREHAQRIVEEGIRVVEEEIGKGADLIGTGDMGIANTTPSAAIISVMTGQSPWSVTGRGTGVGDVQYRHKVSLIEQAISVNKPKHEDALDVLAKVGGYEIGFLSGVILGAAANRRPVVLDGFISGAAALIAHGLAPRVRRYLFASHRSSEPGHRAVLERLTLEPLLEFGMRLGEGTGAALGMSIIEGAVKCLASMATFDEAGVSEKDKARQGA